MASQRVNSETNLNVLTLVLTENDIPGASLEGRSASELKTADLRFWLKCRGDPAKGLKTKAELVKRVEEYIKSGKDKDIVDPDPNNLYLKRKQHRLSNVSSDDGERRVVVKFPENDWGSSLQRMPLFTRAEMNCHITQSGKNIANKKTNSVPTCLRKAKTFLEDEYLHCIETNDDQRCFYIRAKCCHSFRKNDPPHELSIALCIITGDVMKATCSCVAGTVGYCNHILALMLKLCKFTVFECKSTRDLCHETDQNPAIACTSELQKWHKKGGGSNIVPEPIMNVVVNKTKLEDSENTTKRGGIKSLLYEARSNVSCNQEKEKQFKSSLYGILPGTGFSQMARDSSTNLVETKNGKCPVGSILSYQLSFTESNFKAIVDVSSIPRGAVAGNGDIYPRFPLTDDFVKMTVPQNLTENEQSLLEHLEVDENDISHIENITVKQSNCDKWKEERKYRFTASSFDLIRKRKRNHDSFSNTILNPPLLRNKYVEHGKQFEPVALMEYKTVMRARRMPITLLPAGLVISLSHPILGASPDGKVIDPGCPDCFGLVEVKCPWTKANVTPIEACSDSKFFMEKTSEATCRLKVQHAYYAQVQGQMGVTGAQWCDFVVYTKKGLYVQRIGFDLEFWEKLRDDLKSYYFQHFIKYAADEFKSKNAS